MVDTKNAGLFYDMTQPAVMMQYGGLTEMKAYKGNDNKKYGVEFILGADHADLQKMKDLAKQVARSFWGDSVDLASIEWPFKNGNTLSAGRIEKGKQGDLYAGKVVLRPRSKFAVELVWEENGALVTTTNDTALAKSIVGQRFFPGVLALGSLKFEAMNEPRRLVACYLNKVFSTGQGERVGGRSAEEAFKGYIGRAKTEDPTRGSKVNDDIPF